MAYSGHHREIGKDSQLTMFLLLDCDLAEFQREKEKKGLCHTCAQFGLHPALVELVSTLPLCSHLRVTFVIRRVCRTHLTVPYTKCRQDTPCSHKDTTIAACALINQL